MSWENGSYEPKSGDLTYTPRPRENTMYDVNGTNVR